MFFYAPYIPMYTGPLIGPSQLNRSFDLEPTDTTDPKVKAALQQLLMVVCEEFPELDALLEKASQDGMTEEDALAKMLEWAATKPEIAETLQKRALDVLAPLRAEGELLKPTDPDGPGFIFDANVGLPRLNPFFEAAIIERLQFDGDIPEIRTGPLPRGSKPAVPVDTRARNPVALGLMLETASEKVAAEVAESRQKLAAEVEALPEAQEAPKETGLVLVSGDNALELRARGSALTDPSSYRRGELPAPVKVDAPSGSSLALLGAQEARQGAWKFFSTSQGRQSAIFSLQEIISGALQSAGVDVPDAWEGKLEEDLEVLAYVEWTMMLGEQGTTQENFSVIDVAGRAMAQGLLKQIRDKEITRFDGLEVHAVNTVSVRSVGWSARLVR